MKRFTSKMSFWCYVTLMCTALLTGCTQDSIEGQDIPGDGKTVNATFTLASDFVEEIEVRSIAGADEKVIKDLWVVQLNADGTAQLQDPQYITTGFTSTATDYKVSIPLKCEASKIYFITNTHSPSAYIGKTTTAAVEVVTKEITAEADLASADGIPMAGVWTGTPDILGIAGRVSLSRAVAKVNFNLNAVLPNGESFTLKSVTVKQVPKTLNYYRDAATLDTYPYPATPSVMDYPATTYSNVNLIASPQVLWWYLPENARGKGTATIQTDKGVKFPTDPTNQSAYCTYIEVKGWYEATNGTYETVYKIYLGANNTADYNLKRNTVYNVNATIRGIDAADTRINTTDISIIVGMFGGWDDTKKEYTKQLQVDWGIADTDPPKEWANTDGVTNATNKEYGVTNINTLKGLSPDLSAYPAAKHCADKGDGWYLPSQNQLMAIWIAYNSISKDFSFNSIYSYLCSTEDTNDKSWSVNFEFGTTFNTSDKKNARPIRCVKDVAPKGTETPQVVISGTKVILDNRSMPSGAITTSKKPIDVAGGISSDETNKTVSQYFEVAKTDVSSNLVTGENAVTDCKNWGEDGGGWRLPTQRELQLIWTMSRSIEKKKPSGFTMFEANGCWSATAKDNSMMWYVIFLNGDTRFKSTTSTYKARCIRDITPPTN